MLVDQSKTPQARNFGEQEPQYYRLTINYNDVGAPAGAAQKFGALPARAFITAVMYSVETAFNAGTNNNVSIGTSTTATEILAATAMTGSGFTNATAAAGLGLAATAAGPTTLYLKFALSGTAATAGKATIIIQYLLDNDL